jgi:diguanylate cyclase (GGDEF)-like protein/PAS domain S-box-containing protein
MNTAGATYAREGSVGAPGAHRPVALYGAIVVALLLMLCAALAIQGLLQQNEDTQAELASNAELGARALDNYFGKLDVSLRALTESIGNDVGRGDLDTPAFKARATDLLTQFYRFHPDLANTILVKADGHIAVSPNLAPDAAPVFIAGGDSFKKFLSRRRSGLDVGQPIYGQISRSWIVPVRYGVYDQNSELIYFVGASLPVEFIAGFWKEAPVVSKASLGIIRDDGFLVSRYPNSSTGAAERLYGAPRTGVLINFLRNENYPASGCVSGVTSAEGLDSLIVFRRLPNFPLTFFVTLPKANLWAAWWSGIKAPLFLMLMTLIGVLAASIMFSRRQGAYDQALHDAFAALERAARERDAALGAMTQGLCMFDHEQKLIVCNKGYADLYGLTEDQTRTGTTFRTILESFVVKGIVPRDDGAYVQSRMAELDEDKRSSAINQLSDGRYISVIRQPIAGGGWVATHEDVTERRRAEEKSNNIKNFLDTIVQYIPVPIGIKDQKTRRFILVNRAYEKFLGVSRSNILEMTASDLFSAADASRIEQYDSEALGAAEEKVTNVFPLESIAGEQRYVTTTRIVVRDRDEKPQYLIEMIEDITERKIAESRIEHLAHHDALTGLANRHLFRERLDAFLARLSRSNVEFAVLLVDLDGFKAVNDGLGHYAGDALLKEVSVRIREATRGDDLAARLGGDEFALLVAPGNGVSRAGVEAFAGRLIDVVEAPYEIEGQKVVIGCSIGIALAPDHGQSGDELLKCSDIALYKSKNSGRGCFHIYGIELVREGARHNQLENELRQAIWRNELEVYYQPIVDAQTGCIAMMEALVRWRHPQRGLVAPDQFIPLAERSGLIVPLGEWVLTRACRDAAQWPQGIKVAVNLSPIQFAQSRLVDVVAATLLGSRLPPDCLELEITEGVLLKETEQNLAVLRQLKSMGVSISLDDFGVGYSSLSYLTTLPLDKVKIDRSFFEKMDQKETRAVIASIVQLSRSLNLISCAEGIETIAQLGEVRSLGIDVAQGYLFGRPVPLADLKFEPIEIKSASQAA